MFQIVIDTGSSFAITPDRNDFLSYEPISDQETVLTAGGPTKIIGCGIVEWVLLSEDGSLLPVKVPCKHVPSATMRLLSPQEFCQFLGLDQRRDHYGGNANYFWMNGSKTKREIFTCPIDPRTNLPIALAKLTSHRKSSTPGAIPCSRCRQCRSQLIMSCCNVVHEQNKNLSPSQKELLLWHYRFGHIGFQHLQWLMRPRAHASGKKPNISESDSYVQCILPSQPLSASCQPPLCASCEIGKAKRRPTEASHTVNMTDHALRANHLNPGDRISVDHYESPVRGRIPNSKGKESFGNKYAGGTIFFDHASGYIRCLHQVSLRASETVAAKHIFEREARLCGVKISSYHGDNGIFKSKEFTQSIRELDQTIKFSGTGAHHQNGIAERAIRTVTERARTMMHHSSIHWPEVFSVDLWPYALDYATWIHNHTPNKQHGWSPIELFCSITYHCGDLQRLKVWGCPAYVLNPKLQDGTKIPKWGPRARRGQFLGFSLNHSSLIGLIRNLSTEFISPQFHVVYDEKFSTVCSTDEPISADTPWVELYLQHREFYGPERHEETSDISYPPTLDFSPSTEVPTSPKQGTQAYDGAPSQRIPDGPSDTTEESADFPQRPNDDPTPGVGINDLPDASTLTQDKFSSIHSLPDEPFIEGDLPITATNEEQKELQSMSTSTPSQDKSDYKQQPHSDSSLADSILTKRRSVPNKRVYGDEWINSTIISTPSSRTIIGRILNQPDTSDHLNNLVDWDCPYIFEFLGHQALDNLNVDPISREIESMHPFSFAAKASSFDSPSLREIQRMQPPELDEWYDAMDAEISALREKKTMIEIPRSNVPNGKQIVKSTWVFRRKRRPSGEVYKLKARFVVRGDLQKLDESQSTYSPVVAWSTVRLLFVLTVAKGLQSTTIDFNNAFVQSTLPEPIYLELPPGYASTSGSDYVYKVSKSLYGDVRAAKLWYKHLRDTLVDKLAFAVSSVDSCLFFRKDIVFIFYVDDGIIVSPSSATINSFIDELRSAGLDLGVEDDYAGYLGVEVKPCEDGSLLLSQTGLIERIINDLGLAESTTSKRTPVTDVLSKFPSSPPFNEAFNYRSVLGKLMYLSANTRGELSFANHQCARFAVDPREPHATAIKRIGRYLIGTRDKGTIIRKSNELNLTCYADADFAGMFSVTNPDDPKSVKSRTGFVILLGTTPIAWVSKLQSETALSTMEAEYIALSQALRVLLPLRRLLQEVCQPLSLSDKSDTLIRSTIFEDNQACLQLATSDPPRMTPRSKSIAVKYHWFREHLRSGEVEIKGISSEDQLADIFTKPLSPALFEKLRMSLLGW